MKYPARRPLPLLAAAALAGVAALAGCATSDGPAGYEYPPYSVPPGSYAWCPPPCMYPPSAWGYPGFSDLHFFYPATPYFYSPFEVYGGTPWYAYPRPVPPKPPPPPRPTRPPPPKDQTRR